MPWGASCSWRDELGRDGNHTTFDAWLETTGVTGRSTAYKAIRVVEQFADEMAVRFGTEKLHAGLTYLSATRKDEKPGDILALKVWVRGDRGAWTSVPFVEATAGQILQAATAVNASKRTSAVPGELQERLVQFTLDVRKGKGGLKAAQVQVKRAKTGELLVSLKGIPLAQFGAVAGELAGLLVVE